MLTTWRNWLNREPSGYARRTPLILINGLAEQPESWYANLPFLRRHFDVFLPNLLVYDGLCLQRRIDDGQPIDVEFLVDQLYQFLDQFVQTPPFHLVASSLGCKIAAEFAVRFPEMVARLVLLCPSGLSDEERLPIVDGVRRSDMKSLVHSVFHDPSCADPRLLTFYERQFKNRRWRTGLLRTVRGTTEHRIVDCFSRLQQPTLVVVGLEDKICDPQQSLDAMPLLAHGRLLALPQCGHAPQIEKAEEINQAIHEFLTHPVRELAVAEAV